MEGGPSHLGETRILLECSAWLLHRLLTTFLEVDGWEHSRLHQDHLVTFIGSWNGLVAHLTVDIDLTLGQLR